MRCRLFTWLACQPRDVPVITARHLAHSDGGRRSGKPDIWSAGTTLTHSQRLLLLLTLRASAIGRWARSDSLLTRGQRSGIAGDPTAGPPTKCLAICTGTGAPPQYAPPRRRPPADSLILFDESLSLPVPKLKFHPRHPP